MSNLRVLLRTYRPERASIGGIIALLVVGAVLETVTLVLVVPLATAVATENDEINRTIGGIELSATPAALLTLGVVSVVLAAGTRVVTAFAQSSTVIRVEARQRERLYDDFLHASWTTQSTEPPGRFQWTANLTNAHADLLGILLTSLRLIINLAVMLAAAVLVSPLGAIAIGLVGVGIYLTLRPLIRAARQAQERAVHARRIQDETVAETVTLAGEIRAFGVTTRFHNRLVEVMHSVLKEKRIALILAAVVAPLYQSVGMLVALAILGVAAAQPLDVPALGAVALLLLRSLGSAQGLQNVMHKYAEYRPVMDTLNDWYSRYAANRKEFGAVEIDRVTSVDLGDLSYTYDEESPALSRVNLSLLPGDDLGLVGPSGAGKTTLAQVLLRFRDPSAGTYQINGVPAQDISEPSFARAITHVPQTPIVLRGTVHDNVALFRPHVTHDRVAHALRSAGLGPWVDQLPDGYETELGPDMRGMSGGQAQRLAIARAIAGDPSMIVLDEPTSALDVDSEVLVTETLRALPEDVIVVLIAHRMSTLRHCNRIVVLEAGRIAAVGTTAEALEDNAFFRRAVASGALSDTSGHDAQALPHSDVASARP